MVLGATTEAGHLLGPLPRKMPGCRGLLGESLFSFRERERVFVCDLMAQSVRTLGASDVREMFMENFHVIEYMTWIFLLLLLLGSYDMQIIRIYIYVILETKC